MMIISMIYHNKVCVCS